MKKILALLLLPLIVSAVDNPRETWTDPITGIKWLYTIIDGCASLGGGNVQAVPPSTKGRLEIPSVINGYKVIGISENAFRDCCGITNLIIPASVSYIYPGGAFRGCVGLMSVTLPSCAAVSFVCPDTFDRVLSVSIADGVSKISNDVFTGCTNLHTVTIPSTLKDWNDNSRDVIVGDRLVESILPAPTYSEYEVFLGWWCGEKKISTEEELLAACAGGNVTLTAKVVPRMSIDGTVVTVSGMPRQTLQAAYPNMYSLITKVIIGDDVIGLPDGFFDGCGSTLSLEMSDTVRMRMRYEDLLPCEQAAAAYDKNGLLVYDGWVYGVRDRGVSKLTITPGIVGIAAEALCDMADLETVTFPESLRYIGDYAFADDTYLDDVSLPVDLDSIGYGSFEGCSWMQTLAMPGGVKKIDGHAFACCSKLAQVDIPERLVEIGDGAFSNCWRMSSAHFPLSLGCVPSTAFADCTSLTGVTIPTHAGRMSKWFASVYKQITTVTVPEGETLVRNRMFKDCSALTSVVFADEGADVLSIGDEAFSGCSKLTGFEFPASLQAIGDSAFYQCSGLKKIVMPNTVTKLGVSTFEDCGLLADLSISTSIATIPKRAFFDTACTNENVNGYSVPYLIIPASVVFVGSEAFSADDFNDTVNGWTWKNLWRIYKSKEEAQSWAEGFPDELFETTASGAHCYNIFQLNNGEWGVHILIKTKYIDGISVRCPVPLVFYMGDAPAYSDVAYRNFGGFSYVIYGTKGWDGRATSRDLPQSWPVNNEYARPILTWEPNRFDVTFDAAGGTFASSGKSTCVVQETTSAPYVLPDETPTRSGYRFNGWWDSKKDGARISSVKLTKAHTVYAQWIETETLTVRLDANGGTVSPSSLSRDLGTQYGTLPVPVRNHYAFDGWWTESDGGTQVTSASKVTKAGRTIYAHWKYADYEIRFHDGNSGSSSTQYFILGETVQLRTGVFSWYGYELTGWATRADGPVVYSDGQSVREFATRVDKTVDLYAVWERIGYRIVYDANGGQGRMDDQSLFVGERAALSACEFTRFGFAFSGWATSAKGSVAYADGADVVDLATTQGAVVRLYAVWRKIGDVCTVTFDAQGGSSAPSRDLLKGDAVGELPQTSLKGFSFEGWYTKKSGGTKVTSTTKVTASVTYYAHWKKLDTKGAWSGDAVAVTLGKAEKTVTATLVPAYDASQGAFEEGSGVYYYTFTLKNGEGCLIQIDSTYAYVEAIECLTDDAPQIEERDEYTSYLSTSDYTAYLCPDEWAGYKTSSATYIVRISGDVGADITFNFRSFNGWATVAFDAAGGSVDYFDERGADYEHSLEIGDLLPSGFLDVITPTREKYTFDGWFTQPTGGTKVTAKTAIPGDMTLYTHWTFDGSAYVNVVAVDESGDVSSDRGSVSGGGKKFKAGAKVSLKATAKKGYVFAGWYDESGEPLAGGVDYRTPSYTYIATGEEDTTIYAKFIATEDDWVSVDCAAEEEYVKGETMSPIEIAVDSGSLATVKVTGLPTGMKFTAKALSVKATKTTDAAEYAANTIYGMPTKSGVYTATVTATTAGKKTAMKTLKFVVRGEGESIVDVDVVLTDAIGTIASTEAVPGKVTGMGVYATNKKVTLKATANKGYVFMGWYEGEGTRNESEGRVVSKNSSYSFTMPDYDVALEARFITAETDRAAISASVGEEFWFDAESASAEKTISAGVYLEWPVIAEALSATTIKVTGLPTGLKFTAKDITQKIGTGKTAETVVFVPANTIYGTPTAASKTDKNGNVVPSAVKITVTTAGKNSQTFQIDTTVVALPEQVVGTFTGGSCGDPSGSATLTVATSGKVSGKWISEGKTWTLAASGFTSGEPDGDQFDTTLTAKCGKETQEIPLTVTSDGVASCDLFSAYWANWKIEPWKTTGKAMANKKYMFYIDTDGNTSEDAIDSPYGTVTLTMSANGTVKTVGSFVTGTNAKTGKDIVYKASGSTVLTPIDETTYRAFVYFSPKGTFEGYARSLTLVWNGSGFSERWGGGVVCKPVIYLYPETNTTCRVTVKLDGKLTCTYPDHGANGWSNFIASPDGTLTFADGSQYYCLFWEGETQTEWDFSHGYCVKGSDTAAFLADVLLQMGLSFREANEFIIYWLPLMQGNPYNIIAFQGENYINSARLTVDPQPESVLRVFMAWKPSARAVDIPAPVITPFERIGFTLVEWGGTKVQ